MYGYGTAKWFPASPRTGLRYVPWNRSCLRTGREEEVRPAGRGGFEAGGEGEEAVVGLGIETVTGGDI